MARKIAVTVLLPVIFGCLMRLIIREYGQYRPIVDFVNVAALWALLPWVAGLAYRRPLSAVVGGILASVLSVGSYYLISFSWAAHVVVWVGVAVGAGMLFGYLGCRSKGNAEASFCLVFPPLIILQVLLQTLRSYVQTGGSIVVTPFDATICLLSIVFLVRYIYLRRRLRGTVQRGAVPTGLT